jgi:hypothetical protein
MLNIISIVIFSFTMIAIVIHAVLRIKNQ